MGAYEHTLSFQLRFLGLLFADGIECCLLIRHAVAKNVWHEPSSILERNPETTKTIAQTLRT